MIKTVFFDLDNVIINEDLLYFKYFEILWMFLRKQDWNWTFEKIIEEKKNLARRYGDSNPYVTIARNNLPEKEASDYLSQIRYFSKKNRTKYIKVTPGMSFVIRNANHAYNLGIIANQSAEDYDFLTNFKITVPFKTVALSSRLGYAKPNPDIFIWALQNAKTRPEEAVMIGDSRQLDILPAQRLGMHTIHVQFDYKTKGVFPQSSREKLYFRDLKNVDSPKENLLSVLTNLQGNLRPAGIYSATARTPDEILKRLTELETQGSPSQEIELPQDNVPDESREEKDWRGILKDIITELSEQP
jgi:FMN phosphatase YigB (HAD superfamily)